MTSKEIMEERLTEIQVNLEIIRRDENLRHCDVGQKLVEKAIKNLDKLIAPVA